MLTLKIFLSSFLFQVAFVVLAFLAAMFCSYPDPNQDKCPGNYTHPLKVQTVIIIAKVVLWVLYVFFERYVQHHHSRVRRRGYFSIYRSTRHLKSLPLLIHATGDLNLGFFPSEALNCDAIEDWPFYIYIIVYIILWAFTNLPVSTYKLYFGQMNLCTDLSGLPDAGCKELFVVQKCSRLWGWGKHLVISI